MNNVIEQIKNHPLYAFAVLLIPIIVGVWFLSEALRVNTLNQRIEKWKELVAAQDRQISSLEKQVATLSQQNKELNDRVAQLPPKEQPPSPKPPAPPPQNPDGKVIPSLNARLTALRFFEHGRFDEKIYKERFAQAFTKAIGAEITLQHPKPGRRIDFVIQAILRNEPGEVVGRTQIRKFIEEDSESSIHTFKVDTNPTSSPYYFRVGPILSVGSYRLDIYIDDKKVTDGIFEVFSQ